LRHNTTMIATIGGRTEVQSTIILRVPVAVTKQTNPSFHARQLM
jgi:hypothetical protein